MFFVYQRLTIMILSHIFSASLFMHVCMYACYVHVEGVGVLRCVEVQYMRAQVCIHMHACRCMCLCVEARV